LIELSQIDDESTLAPFMLHIIVKTILFKAVPLRAPARPCPCVPLKHFQQKKVSLKSDFKFFFNTCPEFQ